VTRRDVTRRVETCRVCRTARCVTIVTTRSTRTFRVVSRRDVTSQVEFGLYSTRHSLRSFRESVLPSSHSTDAVKNKTAQDEIHNSTLHKYRNN